MISEKKHFKKQPLQHSKTPFSFIECWIDSTEQNKLPLASNLTCLATQGIHFPLSIFMVWILEGKRWANVHALFDLARIAIHDTCLLAPVVENNHPLVQLM
jgi:hypothetical protein